LIEEGHIRVNGRPVKPTHAPRAGEEVEVHWPEPRAAEAQPEPLPLDVLFEDDALLVLNKPAGLVVHPSAGHEEHTLVNALLHHCAGQLSGIGGVMRPGIVHRLDKETSGCIVVAKNDDTHVALSAQFAGRTVRKIYHAILCGEMQRDQGEIRAAIARHPSHRKRMAVSEGAGREARTSYRVLEPLRGATLVEATLHTGRTHQIRVHFQHLGFPLFGDAVYGQRQNRRFEELFGFAAPRVMLHASQLGFVHPRTGKRVSFEAPRPPDFEDALKSLR
jgi:23S rRNA pseudouridine1911/1915/1917 synthase